MREGYVVNVMWLTPVGIFRLVLQCAVLLGGLHCIGSMLVASLASSAVAAAVSAATSASNTAYDAREPEFCAQLMLTVTL